MKTVIIGGVAAGMSAATRLRRLNEDAQIVVFEMGSHVSYANCGLPYFLSGIIEQREDLLLQTPESLNARFLLDVRVRHKVAQINPTAKTVTVQKLDSGEIFEETYDYLVIATGARPRFPSIEGIQRALSLRDVTDVDNLKAAISVDGAKTAVIIGGGFVGIELAENLRKASFDVTVIQRDTRILGGFDPEMIEPLQQRLEEEGVRLKLGATVEKVGSDYVELSNGDVLPADVVIVAAGVVPDNELASAAGLKIGSTGGLWVDFQQRTSDSSIYAAGDAVEKHGELTGEQTLIPLANLANRHGRLIADAISGLNVAAHNSIGTVIIGAFGLSAAMTGLSEISATRTGIPFKVLHLHPSSHAGYYPGAKRISLKVLFDSENGRLLGAQAVGEDGVDKRIDVISAAIFAGLRIDDLMDLELAYAPQFGSAKDAINQAGYVGNNVFTGRTPTVQWHELDAALASGYLLVDVRTESEHALARIPGSINVPVDQLREHIQNLQGQQVLVHCQVGQRGHTATQILRGHGITAANLDGGFITWAYGQGAIQRKERK